MFGSLLCFSGEPSLVQFVFIEVSALGAKPVFSSIEAPE